ncbi:MAG TPA: histidine phosphatase family protein [Bacilli bacterium]|nr:histidine phosphatase family protein [Bacilli bacterium]
MKIFLIRHGESMQNTKENFDLKIPDHLVCLTSNGIEQAKQTGLLLKNYIEQNNIEIDNATLWVSPYERTRQTAKIVNQHLQISDIKEDITLIEQRYGLFSDTPIEECKKKYPEQFEFYDRYYQNDGKFYAKLPQGESPYDVAIRVKLFIDTIFRDLNNGKENIFLVTHGTVIRTFVLDWFHYSPEWFNAEPNMENCSVRLIEKKFDTSEEHYIKGGPIKVLKK